jgi:SAM-dependent methyltransferase
MTAPTIQDRAAGLLGNVAGYVGHRTIAVGLRTGLIETLAAPGDGMSAEELAAAAGHDPFYVSVWCRAALGCGLLERHDDRFWLVEHASTLLLDAGSPAYIGGVFSVLEQREVFDEFEQRLGTGERLWWDRTSHDWIAAVSATGRPFFTRLVAALERINGLRDRLTAGGQILDTACGTGTGLVLLAHAFPRAHIAGADGDAYSLERAAERLGNAGLGDRAELIHTPLETLDVASRFDLITNNVSMHECRDIDAVTANIHRALTPGGWFVISDFPFPGTTEGLRTVPGRVMSGIQFFEALIDDQLLAPSAYRELLTRHGFDDVTTLDLTPMHALTVGRRPR